MSQNRQEYHSLNRVELSVTVSGGTGSVTAVQRFNSFIRQIIVNPTTTAFPGVNYDLVVSDVDNDIFERMGITGRYNTMYNEDNTTASPFKLPAWGTLTFKIENSSKDEVMTVAIYYN